MRTKDNSNNNIITLASGTNIIAIHEGDEVNNPADSTIVQKSTAVGETIKTFALARNSSNATGVVITTNSKIYNYTNAHGTTPSLGSTEQIAETINDIFIYHIDPSTSSLFDYGMGGGDVGGLDIFILRRR